MEYFKTYNKKEITISSNKTRITKTYGGYSSIYGGFVIDNDVNNKIPTKSTKWTFIINSFPDYNEYSVCIGISSTNNINGNAFHYNGSIGYYNGGDVYKDGQKIKIYEEGFKKDDMIIMIHNPCDKTLTFKRLRGGIIGRQKKWYGFKQIKGGKLTQYKPIKMNEDNKKYKMCVYLAGRPSSVELLSFDQYISDNQQNDGNKVNLYTEFEDLFHEEKDAAFDEDKHVLQAIQQSLRSEAERKRKEVHQQEMDTLRKMLQFKNKEIENFKQKQKDLTQIKQEKDGYIAANHRQRSRIVELERHIATLQNDQVSAQIKMAALAEQNNTLKVKIKFYKFT